jgi:hypothetical protein
MPFVRIRAEKKSPVKRLDRSQQLDAWDSIIIRKNEIKHLLNEDHGNFESSVFVIFSGWVLVIFIIIIIFSNWWFYLITVCHFSCFSPIFYVLFCMRTRLTSCACGFPSLLNHIIWTIQEKHVLFSVRGINICYWDDIGNLQDKEKCRGSKDKNKQLNKHTQKKLDKNQRNAVQPSGVRSDILYRCRLPKEQVEKEYKQNLHHSWRISTENTTEYTRMGPWRTTKSDSPSLQIIKP